MQGCSTAWLSTAHEERKRARYLRKLLAEREDSDRKEALYAPGVRPSSFAEASRAWSMR